MMQRRRKLQRRVRHERRDKQHAGREHSVGSSVDLALANLAKKHVPTRALRHHTHAPRRSGDRKAFALASLPRCDALRDAGLDRSARLRPSRSLTRSARLTGGWSASYELVRFQRYVCALEPCAPCQARFAGVLERRSPWRQARGADASRKSRLHLERVAPRHPLGTVALPNLLTRSKPPFALLLSQAKLPVTPLFALLLATGLSRSAVRRRSFHRGWLGPFDVLANLTR